MLAPVTALLFGAVCSAASIPRQTSNSTQSQDFIIHARTKEPANYGSDDSLGYLYAEYSYPPGYSATLHADKGDAITARLTDVNDPCKSALEFPMGDYSYGFKLSPLSEQYGNSLPQIFSGQAGTEGMAIEDGLLQWHSPDEVPISWFACEDWALEWGPATALFYKWSNTTTIEGCKDIDLVIEYV